MAVNARTPLVRAPGQEKMFDYGLLEQVEASNEDQLAQTWLGRLRLKDTKAAAASFNHHGIGGTEVVYLDQSDLREMLPNIGDRKKILASLHSLKMTKVMQKKSQVLLRFHTWENCFGNCCCCTYEDTASMNLLTPSMMRFKEMSSMRNCECGYFYGRSTRKTQTLDMKQITDILTTKTGTYFCDYDWVRCCFGCPFGQLTILAEGGSSFEGVGVGDEEAVAQAGHPGSSASNLGSGVRELVFRVRYGEVEKFEKAIRDAWQADQADITNFAGILADKRT